MAMTATLALGTGCVWQGSPVPVAGDTRALEGEWEGTYQSAQSGRTGTILFRLQAGRDSAYGDVVMFPGRPFGVSAPNLPQIPEQYRQPGRVLRIAFVRCHDGTVSGTLEPYEDPETGERISTTFEGRLEGNRFHGSFASRYAGSDLRVTGEWSVTRKGG
jgi:hypothetical protein